MKQINYTPFALEKQNKRSFAFQLCVSRCASAQTALTSCDVMEHGPNLPKVLTFLDYTEGGEALRFPREMVTLPKVRLEGL